MKESLQRIATWARQHPWLATLILGAVILLGYLVYKRSASSSSSSGTSADLPQGSDQASPIPSMGDIPSSVSTGGSGSVPSSDVGVSTTTGSSTTPSPAKLPNIPQSIPIDLGGISSGWSPSLSNTVSDSFVAATKPNAVKNTQKLPAYQTAQEVVLPGQQSRAERLGYPAGDSKKNNATKTNATKITNRNLATSYGKGKNFTGYIPGIGNFVNGVLTTTKQTVSYTAEGRPTFGY